MKIIKRFHSKLIKKIKLTRRRNLKNHKNKRMNKIKYGKDYLKVVKIEELSWRILK